jgi:hypothetical protein
MAIAPLQPHKSWYRHFWYAKRSPRDTLADRALLFAVVALSLIVGSIYLIRNNVGPRAPSQPSVAESAR